MRGRRWGAAGLAAVLLLAGCALTDYGGRTATANDINGVRTDPDDQGLLVSYTGGACDGRAHLEVTETATRIDADVVIGGGGGGSCTSEGVFRTVSAHLDEPVGDRTVWSGGRQQVPFARASLLVPSPVPPGFARVAERGSADPASYGAAGPSTTTTWVSTYADPAGSPPKGPCRPTRGFLEIDLGPTSVRWARGKKIGIVDIESRRAELFRGGSSKAPTSWAVAWTAAEHSVVVQSSTALRVRATRFWTGRSCSRWPGRCSLPEHQA